MKLDMKNLTKTFNPGTVNEKTAVRVESDCRRWRLRHHRGLQRCRKIHPVSTPSRGRFYVDEGSIALDGEDITFQAGVPAQPGKWAVCFQDPMRGTAPHMTIEENLALAYLRTAKHQNAFFSRTSKADRALFRDQLARLDMGLEDRMRQPVGLLSGGQRQALTLLMVHHGAAQAAAAGRAHRRAGPGNCGEGAGDHPGGGPGSTRSPP